MRFFKKGRENIKTAPISIIKDLLKKHVDCLIIDVRNPSEYRAVHIEGVINIPSNQLQTTIGKYASDKNKPLYVHCAYGNRSNDACLRLIKMGYADVTDLGGIIDWPYDIVNRDYRTC